MSLQIDLDIADAYVTEKAFSVIDSVVRAHDPANFTFSGLWFIPGDKGTTLLPDQVRPDWGATAAVAKWQLTDWMLDTTKWEQVARRGPGDWFLLSKGLATGSLVSNAALVENGGLYVEVFGYGVPGTVVTDLLKVTFGGGLVLHIHSDGHADLEDARPATTAMNEGQSLYLTKGQSLTAGTVGAGAAKAAGAKTDLLGKLLGLVILPYRRGRLLIVTSQGGVFEVSIGAREDPSDHYKDRRSSGESVYFLTTDAGQVTLTPSPSVRCLVAANPLSCSQALAGILTSPVVPLPYAVSAPPLTITGEADTQDAAVITLSVVSPDGSPFAPSPTALAQSLIYQLGFSSPNPFVFPILYSLEMKWERALGNRTYGTEALPTSHTAHGTVTGAHLVLSRDRQQKHFEFTLDNPGEAFTSVKDLWNRRIRCYFDSGGADGAAFGIAAGTRRVIFDGYTDPADFKDGVASTLTISCTGRRKRLRSHLLNDSQKFDGMNHTDVVHQLLHDAGVDDTDIVIFDDGGVPLDTADPGDDPLWRPANGQSTDEFIQHIADTFSGWVFDDIAGVFYYVPKEYFTAAALVAVPTVPTVYLSTPTVSATRPVNTSVLVALSEGDVKQSSKEPVANDFWVLGQDDDGNIVSAHYEDYDSINTRTAANWVGERRTLIYASGSITTVEAAVRTLGPLVITFGQAQRAVAFGLPDYQIDQLPLEGPFLLEGYGPALITDLDADLSCDRSRRTGYACELL